MQRSTRRENIFTKIDNYFKSLVWHYQMRSRIIKKLLEVPRRKKQDTIDMKFFSEINQLLIVNAVFFFLYARNMEASVGVKVTLVGLVGTGFLLSMKFLGQKVSFDSNLNRKTWFGQWLRNRVMMEDYSLTGQQLTIHQNYRKIFMEPCQKVDPILVNRLTKQRQTYLTEQTHSNVQIIKP